MKQERTEQIGRCVRELSAQLLAYARCICADRQLAEDCVQEAFLALCSQRRVDPPAARAWLYRVCRNKVYDAMRRRRFSECRDFSCFNEIAAPDADGAEGAERRELYALVLEKLSSLAPLQREALLLRYYSDMDYEQISRVMGVPKGSVGVHISRGLAGLKSSLGKVDAL